MIRQRGQPYKEFGLGRVRDHFFWVSRDAPTSSLHRGISDEEYKQLCEML